MAETEKPAETPEETPAKLHQYVTDLAPISQQVGENIMQALQTEGTVAVLSTILPGVPTDRVVTMPLTDAQLAGVQTLLTGLQAAAPEDEIDQTCIGFHCHLPAPKE